VKGARERVAGEQGLVLADRAFVIMRLVFAFAAVGTGFRQRLLGQANREAHAPWFTMRGRLVKGRRV